MRKISNKKNILVSLLLFLCSLVLYAQSTSIKEVLSQNEVAANIGTNTTSEQVNAIVSDTTKGSLALQPTPQMAMSSTDYKITAGDIYTLAFAAGTTPVTYTIPVDTSYRIRVANLAVLDVAGKTYQEVKQQVEAIVTKNYPLSGVQFILLTPAVFKVTLYGEVSKTTIKQAWPLTRLSGVVSNLTEFSSTRNIEIKSANGVKKTYDLFLAERFGDLSQDPYVRPDDEIYIHRRDRTVKISGGVERPGTYTLLPGDNLNKLVNYYGGGLVDRADTTRISLKRTLEQDALSGSIQYLQDKDIQEDLKLLCYDEIFIPTYSDLKPIMFIEGAIYASNSTSPENSNKIAITFNQGENYAALIRRNKSVFSSVSDTENAYIIRNGKTIPININFILYDASYYTEEVVTPYDTLLIPFKQYFVTVAGAVNNPGRYPYIPDRDWEYYVGLAGGFIKNQNAFDKVTIVNLQGNVLTKSDPITPETSITANTNAFTYYFSTYSPVITTILSILSTTFTILAVTQ